MQLETATRSTMCDYQTALVNGGSCKIYDASNNLLVTIALNATAYGSASSGVANIATTPSALTGNPSQSGTASYFTMCNSGGTVKWSDLVGVTGGTEHSLNLGSLTISVGVPVTINSGSLTVPSGTRT